MSSEKNMFEHFEGRKQAVAAEDIAIKQAELTEQSLQEKQAINQLEDSDMPAIESLNEDSDYSMFMSEKVSEALRKKAFRKMFLSPTINVLDGLNDYDEDYTFFQGMGEVISYHLKEELKRKAKEEKEEMESLNEEEEETISQQAPEHIDSNDAEANKEDQTQSLNTKQETINQQTPEHINSNDAKNR